MNSLWFEVGYEICAEPEQEQDQNTRPCNCGSGESWVDCHAPYGHDFCG